MVGRIVNQKSVVVIHPKKCQEGWDDMSQAVVDSIRLSIMKKRELEISILEKKRDNINEDAARAER